MWEGEAPAEPRPDGGSAGVSPSRFAMVPRWWLGGSLALPLRYGVFGALGAVGKSTCPALIR